MTFAGISRRFRGLSRPARRDADQLIGEAADRTFSCPGCARPLAIGQGRCPGCGSLLVAGILVRTALFLILVGTVVGMVGGAVIAGAAMAPRLAVADEARAASAAGVAAPAVATPMPTAAATPPPVARRLPDGVAGAILQVATSSRRLGLSASALTAVLDARTPSSAEIALLLRKVAADVRAGGQAARHLARWEGAALFASDASTLYGAAAAVAAEGLAAPLADRVAYVAAGRRMLAVLEGLAALDVATREVAASAGIALPASP